MSEMIYIVAILLCVFLSSMLTASATALASANKVRLENLTEEGNKRAKIAFSITERPDRTLSALTLGNHLVNTSAVILAIRFALLTENNMNIAVFAIVVALLIIIFGEAVPYVIAMNNSSTLAVRLSYFSAFITTILLPITAICEFFVRIFVRPSPKEESVQTSGDDTATEELAAIIDTVEDEGVIDEERSELLHAALTFSTISATEVMTARVDVMAIDVNTDFHEIYAIVEDSTHSRLPIYEGSLDNIIGVLYLNHFLKAVFEDKTVNIRDIMIEPCYVYKTMKLPAVLGELKKKKTHIAVVTDEYGGSMGIITMEDVLEELVGDIWDETDEIEQEIIETSDGVYKLDGDLSVSDFLELMELDEDEFESGSATIGGWCIEVLGHFAITGESFRYKNLTIKIDGMDGLRVDHITVKADSEDE